MKNVLVVDDNKCIRDVLSLVFEALLKDCTIRTAENGAKAVEIFDSSPVNAIITDLSMPVMDGYRFMEHVRSRSSETPIIVMSGESGPDVDERLKAFSVVRRLEKPFDPQEAVKVIASVLGLTQITGAPAHAHTREDFNAAAPQYCAA